LLAFNSFLFGIAISLF